MRKWRDCTLILRFLKGFEAKDGRRSIDADSGWEKMDPDTNYGGPAGN